LLANKTSQTNPIIKGTTQKKFPRTHANADAMRGAHFPPSMSNRRSGATTASRAERPVTRTRISQLRFRDSAIRSRPWSGLPSLTEGAASARTAGAKLDPAMDAAHPSPVEIVHSGQLNLSHRAGGAVALVTIAEMKLLPALRCIEISIREMFFQLFEELERILLPLMETEPLANQRQDRSADLGGD